MPPGRKFLFIDLKVWCMIIAVLELAASLVGFLVFEIIVLQSNIWNHHDFVLEIPLASIIITWTAVMSILLFLGVIEKKTSLLLAWRIHAEVVGLLMFLGSIFWMSIPDFRYRLSVFHLGWILPLDTLLVVLVHMVNLYRQDLEMEKTNKQQRAVSGVE